MISKSEEILPTPYKHNYTIVNKVFLKKLLQTRINPQAYITKKLTPDEQRLHDTIVQMVDEQLQASIDKVTKEKLKEIELADVKRRQEIFKELEDELSEICNSKAETVEQLMQEFYNQGALKGYNDIKRDVAFTLADEYALFNITQYGFDQIRGLSSDVTAQVRTEIWRGVADGSSIPKIRRRLEEVGLQPLNVNGRVLSPKVRAEMIARTETARARSGGALQAYANYGVDEGDWICSEGACDICLDIQAGNPYSLEELAGKCPAHPNCRCAVGAHTGIEVSSEPVDNPKVIDVTTTDTDSKTLNGLGNTGQYSNNNIIGDSEYYKKNDVPPIDYENERKYLKNKISKQASDDLTTEEIDELVDNILKVKLETHGVRYEKGLYWDVDGTYIGKINATPQNRFNIIPDNNNPNDSRILSEGEIRGFSITGHNHPDGLCPLPGGRDTRSIGEYQTGKSVITSDNGRYSVIVNKNKGKMSQEELNTIDKEFRKFYDECDELVAENPVYGEEIKELDNKLDSDNSFGMDEYKQEKEILRSRYMNDHIDYATERVGGILERHNIKLYYI